MTPDEDPRVALRRAYGEGRTRYPYPAYVMIQEALHFTLSRRSEIGHISGEELSLGVADFMKERHGPLARIVLHGWNIYSTSDFGQLVYDLIGLGVLAKQDQDSQADFDNVFEFESVFGPPYDWKKSHVSR